MVLKILHIHQIIVTIEVARVQRACTWCGSLIPPGCVFVAIGSQKAPKCRQCSIFGDSVFSVKALVEELEKHRCISSKCAAIHLTEGL
jgi:hypothetical protein